MSPTDRGKARVRGGRGGGSARRAVSIALVSVTCVACAPDRPSRGARLAREAFLADVSCRSQIVATLDEWGAGPEYLGAPPVGAGSRVYRFPTGVLGEWAVLEAPAVGPPVITLMTATSVTVRRFQASCTAAERVSSRPSGSADEGSRFTDGDLRSLLESALDGPVVVYAWSPHMPLSVDGYAEIVAAGTAFEAVVVPLLIAHGDLDFAAREASRVGMPPDGLRQIDANELVLRDAQLHAPSLLVFGLGRVSPVLPGYRNAAGYRRYLAEFMTGSPRPNRGRGG